MADPQKGHRAVDPPGEWWQVAADGQEFGSSWAPSPWAMPVFFAGWIGIGVLVGMALARRGHDRRAMLGLGAGLGPLMLLVASDAVSKSRSARPLVLAPGLEHGGDLDVLVLIQGNPQAVRLVTPTLEAVASEVGTLTLARAVPFDWLEQPEGHDDELAETTAALVAARELVPIGRPALVVFPGAVPAAVRRFEVPRRRTLVLHAIAGPSPTPGRR